MRKKIEIIFKRFSWIDWVLIGLLGAGLLYLLLFSLSLLGRPSQSVEYIAGGDTATLRSGQGGETQIWVDVSGAVARPGVYQLPGGARIKDALIAAGGLTDEADRDFVSTTINLAAKVKDGDKVHIPTPGGEAAGVATGRVNLNKATSGELEGLPGIGSARAGAIIENRPYASVDDLVTKKVIPVGVLNKIRDKVAVY